MKQKLLYSGIIAIVLFVVCIFSYSYYKKVTTIHFLINNKEATSHEITLEYKEDLVIDKDMIKLSAIQNRKDISDQILIQNHTFSQLKEYTIDFYIKDNEDVCFPCNIKIVDTTAPTIEGEKTYKMYKNEKFDASKLKLKAYDLYDKDITNKIQCKDTLDTSKVGNQTLLYEVSDSSGNKSKHEVKVTIHEKVEVTISAQPTINNQRSVVSNPNDITLLLNKSNSLPNGWVPSDLVSLKGGQYLRSEAAQSATSMQTAAQTEGITMNIISSYRSQSTQVSLYNSYIRNDPYNAPYYSAPPRSSEHELGLAIDISFNYQLRNDLHLTSLGYWMQVHAHEYGWILRYPSDKTQITGYMFEPWHYRYVGVDLATYLRNNNLTLEEYY